MTAKLKTNYKTAMIQSPDSLSVPISIDVNGGASIDLGGCWIKLWR